MRMRTRKSNFLIVIYCPVKTHARKKCVNHDIHETMDIDRNVCIGALLNPKLNVTYYICIYIVNMMKLHTVAKM